MKMILRQTVFRENIILEDEDDILANDETFRENINLEDEDDTIANGDAFRENINFEDEDDILANGETFRENISLEDKDDTIANGGTSYNFQDEENIIPKISDEFKGNNGNEDDRPPSYTLFTFTLEYIKNVLYVALHQFFDEFEIAVVGCPCLTKPPYNLAADGLSGNTGILQMGDIHNLIPIPQTQFIFDIQPILSSHYYDFFIIGSGFAATPFMSYDGHLTINMIVSANPTNVINNSCNAYEDAGLKRLEIINDPNQISCTMLGNLFFSEGRQGMVIKMRAKGCKTIHDIILLIQYSLYFYCQYPIGLGVVLVIDGGQTVQLIIPENYPLWCSTYMDFYRWIKYYKRNCMNLIAMGTLTNSSFIISGRIPDGNVNYLLSAEGITF